MKKILVLLIVVTTASCVTKENKESQPRKPTQVETSIWNGCYSLYNGRSNYSICVFGIDEASNNPQGVIAVVDRERYQDPYKLVSCTTSSKLELEPGMLNFFVGKKRILQLSASTQRFDYMFMGTAKYDGKNLEFTLPDPANRMPMMNLAIEGCGANQ